MFILFSGAAEVFEPIFSFSILSFEMFQAILNCSYHDASICNTNEPRHEKTCFAKCEQQSADQPAHPRSLISAFVVRRLDSIISLVSISEISSLQLVSESEQAGLGLTWSHTPKTDFLVTRLKSLF